jgi:hypothetical protein
MPTTIAIPRPGAGEHLAYYSTYIAKVPGDDALTALSSHLESWQGSLRRLTEAQGLHRYAPGKWSVKEVINHVSDGERVFAYRALRFARADATPLPGFDENAWAPSAGSDRRPVADLVDELLAVRASTVALFRSFDAEAMARIGTANQAPISVRALGWIIAGHAIHHQSILRERYGIAS